jgi:phage terminase large subunit-like protein
LAKVAEMLDHPLMPWQRQVADVGLEIDPQTGLPAYREIVVTVMRQSGKSILLLSFQLDRCLSWPGLRRCAYTAQSGFDARKKLLRDYVPILKRSRLWPAVEHVRQSQGDEGLTFTDMSEIAVVASNLSAGHGRSWDLGVIDEAFDDEDDRREQAIVPALATRADGQLLVASTAGTTRSAYLRRKLEAGRLAVEMDSGHGIAFFEWSIPDDADIDDPETWWSYMPALGWTIQPEAVAHARQSMSEAEFRRSFCNQWVSMDEAWLPPGAWAACRDDRPIPDLAEVVLGFDGSFSNDSTALVAVQLGERPHLDVAACWERPPDADEAWRVPILDVEDAIRQACRRWQVREIVCDPFRWARTFQVLEDDGLPVVEFPQSPARMVPATQRFYEAVVNKTLTHSGDERLARHIGNCVLKVDSRGQRLAKDTKNSPRKIDLAVAAVMAADRAAQRVEQEQPFFGAWR